MRNMLVKWIVIKQHPFTIVEEEEFINVVYSLYPNAKIPSADTIKRDIMGLYATNLAKMQTVLQKLDNKISFTTDIWTSASMKSFLSITAHFIDSEWQLQNIIVDFVQIFGSHTGINIKNSFVSGLENLSIQKKVNLFFYFYVLILIKY
jgi:hypothetical protein